MLFGVHALPNGWPIISRVNFGRFCVVPFGFTFSVLVLVSSSSELFPSSSSSSFLFLFLFLFLPSLLQQTLPHSTCIVCLEDKRPCRKGDCGGERRDALNTIVVELCEWTFADCSAVIVVIPTLWRRSADRRHSGKRLKRSERCCLVECLDYTFRTVGFLALFFFWRVVGFLENTRVGRTFYWRCHSSFIGIFDSLRQFSTMWADCDFPLQSFPSVVLVCLVTIRISPTRARWPVARWAVWRTIMR